MPDLHSDGVDGPRNIAGKSVSRPAGEGHTQCWYLVLDQALADKQLVMVLIVLTEMLSDPKLDAEVGKTLAALRLAEMRDGF